MLPAPAVSIQGQGVVPADLLNSFGQTCLNVAQARGFIGRSNMWVLVLGTDAPGDGGQGTFFWYTGAGLVDDGGATAIVPAGTVGTGGWVRLALGGVTANSVTNADLALTPADTLKGNNTGSTADVADLTVAQAAALLGGQTSDTLAKGNDSRFTAIGQIADATNARSLALTDQAKELYFTYAGAVAVDIPALAWTPSAVIVLRVKAGCTVTLTPDGGMSLTWIPSGSTGARTITGPALTNLTFATATAATIGAGGVS